MNKKRLFSYLLGGGVTTTALTLGGIKLNEKISWDRKIREFRKISDGFNSRSKEFLKEDGWYLPNYEDDEAWQETYNSRHVDTKEAADQQKRTSFIARNPDWKTFKENCYAEAKNNLSSCHSSDGWCGECKRSESWSLEAKRKEKK